MDINNVTPQRLRHAADIQERIQSLQQELTQILGAEPNNLQRAPKLARGRRMSAAGRARIAAAARARWARLRAERGLTAPARKPKRRVSPATRARLAAIARARWQRVKAAGQAAL